MDRCTHGPQVAGEVPAESAGVTIFSKIAGPPGNLNHGPAGRAMESVWRAVTTAVADLLD